MPSLTIPEITFHRNRRALGSIPVVGSSCNVNKWNKCLYLWNETFSPCLHSLVKTEANLWKNSRADQWKPEMHFACSRILTNFAEDFTRLWRCGKHAYFFLKLLLLLLFIYFFLNFFFLFLFFLFFIFFFLLNKKKNDIRGA